MSNRMSLTRTPFTEFAPRIGARRALLSDVAVVVSLTVATYALLGYDYPAWPQPTVLEYVLHFRGALVNDWFTSLPPPHWMFDHVLAWVPAHALRGTLELLWVVQCGLFWVGFVALRRSIGLSAPAAFAAGLIAIPTGLDGVGSSVALTAYTYPTGLSFALAVCSLAAILAGRLRLAGLAAGGAILFHPELGALAVLLLAPAVLLARGTIRDKALRFLPGVAIVGGASFVEALLTQAGGTSLSAQRRYQLVAVIRHPQHMLYESFPGREYVQTIGWLIVAVIAIALLRGTRAVRTIAAVAATVIVLASAGGIASAAGGPL